MKNIFYLCNPSIKHLLLLGSLFSLALLSAALIGQYFFGLHPCELCIYQRIPYALIAFIGLIGFYFIKSPRMLYYLAGFCCLLFLADAGVAFYHSGVEYGFFPSPSTCSSNSGEGQTIEEMRAAIMGAPLVSCAQAMLYIGGFSMASWNAMAAFLAFCGSLSVLLRKRNIL